MPKLYTNRLCPFAHRARLVLREKGIVYLPVEIDLKNMPEWYRALSPNQKVPLLELDDGQLVWESAIIGEYLEEAYPVPALLPQDPLLRSRYRLAQEQIGSTLISAFTGVLRNGDDVSKLTDALDTLEAHDWLGGPFWLGRQLTLVDLNLYPWFERLPLAREAVGLDWDEARWPKLSLWKKTLSERSAVIAEAGSPEEYRAAYRGMQAAVVRN